MPWYRKRGASTLLRLIGLALLALAAWFATRLRQQAITGPIDHDPTAYLFALVSFLGGTAGLTLGVLGNHIYDRVERSRRWSRQAGS